MSARNDLLKLYAQWREWSDAEAAAIRGAAWPQVTKCQNAKLELQDHILQATERWQAEANAEGQQPMTAVDPQIRRLVDELILLELRNSDLLADQRRRHQAQHGELNRSSRNLRQLQRAYAPSREALWQSYS